MKPSIGAALVAGALWMAGPSAITEAAAAAPQVQTSAASRATDFRAHRYSRRHYHEGRQPHYYARPYYYRPYPYNAAAPFPFGLGFGPLW